MTTAAQWLKRVLERNDPTYAGHPWQSGDTVPAAPGWYERRFTDGIFRHYFDGSLWRAARTYVPHWRQVGDYPCWRVAEPAPIDHAPEDLTERERHVWALGFAAGAAA